VIEQLAFPDHAFDVVLSTLVMHHLPDDLKRLGLAELVRVLKPGGRLVIIDFKRAQGSRIEMCGLAQAHLACKICRAFWRKQVSCR